MRLKRAVGLDREREREAADNCNDSERDEDLAASGRLMLLLSAMHCQFRHLLPAGVSGAVLGE